MPGRAGISPPLWVRGPKQPPSTRRRTGRAVVLDPRQVWEDVNWNMVRQLGTTTGRPENFK